MRHLFDLVEKFAGFQRKGELIFSIEGKEDVLLAQSVKGNVRVQDFQTLESRPQVSSLSLLENSAKRTLNTVYSVPLESFCCLYYILGLVFRRVFPMLQKLWISLHPVTEVFLL